MRDVARCRRAPPRARSARAPPNACVTLYIGTLCGKLTDMRNDVLSILECIDDESGNWSEVLRDTLLRDAPRCVRRTSDNVRCWWRARRSIRGNVCAKRSCSACCASNRVCFAARMQIRRRARSLTNCANCWRSTASDSTQSRPMATVSAFGSQRLPRHISARCRARCAAVRSL
jgi:hypothetical protein